MPQARPEYLEGIYYHFYNRGAHRISIFRGEKDYLRVLGLMKKYMRQFQLAIIAYVLMPNHYHFLVRRMGKNLPVIFRNIFSTAIRNILIIVTSIRGHSLKDITRSNSFKTKLTFYISAAIFTGTPSRTP